MLGLSFPPLGLHLLLARVISFPSQFTMESVMKIFVLPQYSGTCVVSAGSLGVVAV